MNTRSKGVLSAIGSALLLGVSPILGKQAFLLGFSPLAVVSIRTFIAAMLLFLFLLIFKRAYFTIYPVGLWGCLLAGFVNGLGSMLYYGALARLDASIGQLLYSFYPLFVALWLVLDRQVINRITLVRLSLVIPGVILLVSNPKAQIDILGSLMMIGAALLYALHLLINQRILFDAPAPTVTFYTLVSMTVTVTGAYLLFDRSLPVPIVSWLPIIILGATTFLSRITLFLGVKHIGGLQTALMGLGELLITIVLAHIFLGDQLSLIQWLGAILITINILLVAKEKPIHIKNSKSNLFAWLSPPRISSTEFPQQ